MLVTDNFIRHPKCSLHYAKAGRGSKKYLVFHGFGQDHTIGKLFGESEEGTYYLFDLFFHGKSKWHNPDETLEKDTWIQIMDEFIRQERISTFSLVSFSLGSRFALVTMEAFPDKVLSNCLVAPDGLRRSFWYWLATYPFITRKLFKSMIMHPGWFHLIANTIRELWILDKMLIRFAESQMNTQERRERVYNAWVVFRHMQVHRKKIAELVNHFQIRTMVIVGRSDKVITEKWAKGFIRNLATRPAIVRLDCGHTRLFQEAVRIIFNEKKVPEFFE